jgi:hypothetical protein
MFVCRVAHNALQVKLNISRRGGGCASIHYVQCAQGLTNI